MTRRSCARFGLRWVSVLTLALATAGAARPAYADGVDPAKATPVQRELAQGRFMKGRDLFGQGQFAPALEEFKASHEIVASPNARLYAARCMRELGRLVASYSEFGRASVEAREQTRDDPRYVKTGESADEERKAIAPKLGFATVTITGPDATTTLTVAGESIRRSGWSEPIPLSPGANDVTVETPGRQVLRQSVVVAAGETKAVTFDAGAAPALPAADPPGGAVTAVPPPAAREDRNGLRTMSFVAGGVGVAGFATFAAFGALSSGKYNDLKTACGGPCPPSRQSDIDAGKRDQTIANVGLTIGLIGIVTGVTLFLVSAPKKPVAAAGFVVFPTASGLGGTF